MATGSAMADADELESFRRQWKEEVEQRKRHQRQQDPARERNNGYAQPDAPSKKAVTDARLPGASTARAHVLPTVAAAVLNEVDSSSPADRPDASASSASPPGSPPALASQIHTQPRAHTQSIIHFNPQAPANANASTQKRMQAAIEIYAVAVKAERAGRLDDALTSYRKAFRLDSNVDRLYQRAQASLAIGTSSASAGVDFVGALDTGGAGSLDWGILAVQSPADFEAALRARRTGSGEKDIGRGAPVSGQKSSARTDEESKGKSIDVHHHQPTTSPNASMIATGAGTGMAASMTIKSNPPTSISLDALLSSFSALSVNFTPEDEEAPLPISRIPDELLVHILAYVALGRRGQGVDVTSLEMAARASRKFREVSRDDSIWREIVHRVYVPPQIPRRLAPQKLYAMHNQNWRTAFINQPRLRLNGAYISTCQYIRKGHNEENVWINVVHVIEYFRTLRFLPSGQVLALLTTDPPSETVRRLEPGLSMKGFSTGQWRLLPDGIDDDALKSDLPETTTTSDSDPDAEMNGVDLGIVTGKAWARRRDAAFAAGAGQVMGPRVVIENIRDETMKQYAFTMELRLRSTTRGKWNRLDMIEYCSIHLGTGEVLPLPQKHQKPFYFSRVKAYGI